MGVTLDERSRVSAARRRALVRAMGLAAGSIVVAGGLAALVDSGARLLGPVLIVFGALAGLAAVRAWWDNLAEQWFAAEIVLVTAGWALFGASLAAIQFLLFSFLPGHLHVDPDLGRLIAQPQQAEWTRDSAQAALAAGSHQLALTALVEDLPDRLTLGTTYHTRSGSALSVAERCDDLVQTERCAWTIALAGPSVQPIELSIEAPGSRGNDIAKAALIDRLREATERRRAELAKYRQASGAPIRPRIADFLYDTAIAFSGRESGVFVPLSALARVFKVIESLASYVLFGVVVSRVAAAATTELSRRT